MIEVKKIDIIKEAVIGIFGEEVMENRILKPIIEEEAEKIIDLEMEHMDEGPWKTFQYDNEALPHGFIYYSCNVNKLHDLFYAIEVHQMLEAKPLRL